MSQSSQPAERPELLAGNAGGSIYDLGYRGYTGPRLGRRHAVRALYVHSLKWTWGIGRGGRAKIAPFALTALALLPAIVVSGVRALGGPRAEELVPIGPATYPTDIQTLLAFFVIAQAPELLGRDQRHGSLTLYFSRALQRTDYAVAKWLALVTSIALVILVPETVLVLGTVFASTDLVAGLRDTLPTVPATLATSVLVAALLGGIGLAISAFTPRRAFAAGAIVAVFLVLSGVVQVLVLRGIAGPFRVVALLDPSALVDGLSAWFFGRDPRIVVLRSGLAPEVFGLSAIAISALCLAILVLRYRRIQA